MIIFDPNGAQNQYQDLDTQDGFCTSCQLPRKAKRLEELVFTILNVKSIQKV